MNHHSKQNILNMAVSSALAFGFCMSSHAADAIATLSVTATVIPNCIITATAVGFGNYDPIVANSSSAIDSQGSIKTTCTIGSAPTIALGDGANADTGRRLRMGATNNFLTYELYSDTHGGTVWGATGIAAPTPTGTEQTSVVYGRLAGGQNQATGTYSDMVVATVSF